MQFIRLSTLRQQFPLFSFPLTEQTTDTFRAAFYAHPLSQLNGVHENEQWLSQLRSQEFVLFMDWAEQEGPLAGILDKSGPLIAFQNRTKVTDHALFGRFQSFITPFLFPRLNERLKNTQPETWQAGLSYLVLLQEREADLLQNTIYEQLKARYEQLEIKIREARTEDDLHRALHTFLTPQLIATLNLFTSSFYRVKTIWISILKQVAHHKAGTNRVVLYLINELKPLQLNPDHQKELREAEREIRIGAVRVDKRPFPWTRTLVFSGLGLLVTGLLAVIWMLPSQPERDKPQEKTAFMDFTVRERKTIDSLLQHIKMERRHDENVVDGSDMDYVGEELVVNIPWENQDVEYIVSQWEEKDTVSRTPDPAFSKKETRPFPMTEPLGEKNGSIRAKFQNDTEISVLVMVFKDRADEWVYSQYIEKGAVASFKLYPDEHLIVVPGSKVPKHLNAGGLPFEQVDSRFFEHLRNDYVVDELSPKHIKLVWKQLNNYDFYLLDISGALNR
jgi:hypothetical protein